MRAIGAFLVIIAILALLIGGLQYQSDAVQDRAIDNGTNTSADTYNFTNDLMDVTGDTLTMTLVWGGFAAFAFVAVGLLIAYGGRGR